MLSYDDLKFAREEVAAAQEDVRFASMRGTVEEQTAAAAKLNEACRMVTDIRRAIGKRCIAEAAKILGATVEEGR